MFSPDVFSGNQLKSTAIPGGTNGVPASQSVVIIAHATSNAPATSDIPATSNMPVTSDIPVTSDMPVTSQILTTDDIPATSDKPVTSDIPTTSDKPVTSFSCAGRVNGDHYPDPYDCAMYYQCSNGIAYHRSCGPDLHFKVLDGTNGNGGCVLSENANCNL